MNVLSPSPLPTTDPEPTDPRRLAGMLRQNLDPYPGPWDEKGLKHLLRRSLFGTSAAEVEQFLLLGNLENTLSALCEIKPPASLPLVNYTDGDGVREPNAKDGETWIHEEYNNELEYYRLLSLKTWWLDLMLKDQTLMEKMVIFWHNHIPVEMVGVFHARQAYDYLATIRQYALGNFRQLIKALTLDPMMLFYLNGNSNNKSAPDENYARELQELFCIGKGPEAKFTEDDVKAAARVLTGWKSDYLKPKTFFAEWAHDTGDKTFSDFYGGRVIRGQKGSEGQKELDELIDMLISHPECARFICRKLYRFFVYPEISDWSEENIIRPLADLFIKTDFEIAPVVKALLSSNHFFDPLLRLAMIKSPLDYTIGLNRHFGMRFPSSPGEIKSKFQAQTVMYYFLTSFQQDIGDPPNVSGWPAYYQFPQYDRSWISTHTVHQRGIHSDMLVWYGYQMDQGVATIDWPAYTDTLIHPENPNLLIEEVLGRLYDVPVDAEVKKYLKSILLSGQVSDHYWTNAWQEWKSKPNDPMARNTVDIRLKIFYQYILQMDEYQIM
ncbi:MAG TPA: DUF1800 domain-containing protein [Saprospiraceae bacterium]|nr:DUF1800 domain-containing protein [Saprospiraceae bacterium]